MSRLSEWIDIQRRLVQHGGGVAIFRLKGPDDSTWGTWPIETENLADTISVTLSMIADELPKGRHPCVVRAYDENGGEISVMPVSVEGKSSAAASAAAEQLTLQKATSAAIYNANVMNEGLRKQVEHMNGSLAQLAENNVLLIDQMQAMAASMADRDLRDARRDAANEAFLAVCSAVKAHAEPLLELALMKWKPKTLDAPKLEPTPEPTHEPEQRHPTSEPGNGAHSDCAVSAERTTSDARQRPAGDRGNGAARDSARSHAPPLRRTAESAGRQGTKPGIARAARKP